jgi:large subunit ribosomal protein L13
MQKMTYMPKKEEQDRKWVLVDLDGAVLGRAATRIANILRGKHKPTFTRHIDMGDFVVAINAEKIRLTGNKLSDKIYYRHSGYRGGLKQSNAGDILEKKPEQLIRSAVSGMLPKNKTRKHLLTKLRVYLGTEHPHEAQMPEPISLNDKEVTAKAFSKAPAKKAVHEPEKKVEAKPAKEVAVKKESKAVEKPVKKTEEKPAKKAAPKAESKVEAKKEEKAEKKPTKKATPTKSEEKAEPKSKKTPKKEPADS